METFTVMIDLKAVEVCRVADHLADQVAVAKAWGENLAAFEAAVKEKEEEITYQDAILNPGEYIHEQARDGFVVCILRKDLWDIRSIKDAQKQKEQIAALTAERRRDAVDGQATMEEAYNRIKGLEGDNEILRNMNKILKQSHDALTAERDRYKYDPVLQEMIIAQIAGLIIIAILLWQIWRKP